MNSDVEYSRKYRKEHKEQIKNAQNRYYLNNPERNLVNTARYRSRKLGIQFNITAEDIHIPDICPILGIELKRNIGGKRPMDNSPTIDKINPNNGYVKGNIMIISHKANRIKNNATPAELFLVASFVMNCEGGNEH